MINTAGVGIIGAGPYGLSIAAYLADRGFDVRIFGRPMDTWSAHMPKGMFLKSEGFASSLYDPKGEFPLAAFCAENGTPYKDWGLPVALDTFCAYGLAFQQKYVPQLDRRDVARIVPATDGFDIVLEDGEVVRTGRVIVAAGISHYAYVPPVLASLPDEVVAHSSRYHDYERFAGKRVLVVGAGASAIDVALSLHDAGATTELVARTEKLAFHDPPLPKRSLLDRLLYPRSGIGCGVRSRFYADRPDLFALLPSGLRASIVRTHLGPAPCWFTKAPFLANVATRLGVELERCEVRDGRVRVHVVAKDGAKQSLEADHVIAATGYRVDVARLPFLDADLRAKIRTDEGSPILSRSFESSVPGMYFVGLSAAATFGPLLRFAVGSKFTAGRVRAHLAGNGNFANS